MHPGFRHTIVMDKMVAVVVEASGGGSACPCAKTAIYEADNGEVIVKDETLTLSWLK